MKDLTPKLETLVQQDALEEALSKLKCVEPELKSATEFKKIKANLLLATSTATFQVLCQELKPLVSAGTLDASPALAEEQQHIPHALCVSIVTRQAAEALSSSGIQCLNVQSNPRLCKLPVKELCAIPNLNKLECTGCPQLLSLPVEVADMGGVDSMRFLREYEKEPTNNDSLALFLVGGGECGKTSVKRALVNEDANVAPAIDKDTRTVGMDMEEWSTVDNAGQVLNLKIKDVGGQDLYIHLHELFLLRRAVYLFMWRADHDLDKVRHDVTVWLNLLQSACRAWPSCQW